MGAFLLQLDVQMSGFRRKMQRNENNMISSLIRFCHRFWIERYVSMEVLFRAKEFRVCLCVSVCVCVCLPRHLCL